MRSIPVATLMREKLLRLSESWFVQNKSKLGLLRAAYNSYEGRLARPDLQSQLDLLV